MPERRPVPKKNRDLGEFDLPSTEASEILSVQSKQIEDEFDVPLAFKCGFVGIGQGGSRIASAFYRLGYRRVVVIDGAQQDLLDVPDGVGKLDLGTSGSAKDISVGAASVAGRKADVWRLIEDGIGDCELIIVCACCGGGTGGGAAAQVVEICREAMARRGTVPRVGCLVSIPSDGEGPKVCHNAIATFRQLWDLKLTPLIIIDNQRIAKLFPVGVTRLFAKCNEQIVRLFHAFNRLSAQRSQLMTFDKAEFASLLDSGLVTFGASSVPTDDTNALEISDSVGKQLSNTTLAQVDLRTATSAACLFLGNESTLDNVSMDALSAGFDACQRAISPDGVVHRGIYVMDSAHLMCMTMFAGLFAPAERLKQLARQSRLSDSVMAQYFGVE